MQLNQLVLKEYNFKPEPEPDHKMQLNQLVLKDPSW